MRKVKVTVDSIKGECCVGCKKGDVFYYEDGGISLENPAVKLCAYGLSAIIPYLAAYCRSESEDDWMSSFNKLQCPDPLNRVIFRLEKMD